MHSHIPHILSPLIMFYEAHFLTNNDYYCIFCIGKSKNIASIFNFCFGCTASFLEVLKCVISVWVLYSAQSFLQEELVFLFPQGKEVSCGISRPRHKDQSEGWSRMLQGAPPAMITWKESYSEVYLVLQIRVPRKRWFLFQNWSRQALGNNLQGIILIWRQRGEVDERIALFCF